MAEVYLVLLLPPIIKIVNTAALTSLVNIMVVVNVDKTFIGFPFFAGLDKAFIMYKPNYVYYSTLLYRECIHYFW